MSRIRRVILDTSTLVSAALRPGSVPDHALLKAMRTCEICASMETLEELAPVLDRGKFDRYLDKESRRAFVTVMRRHLRLFAVQQVDRDAVDPPCRDPADNKLLALALASEANALVSSDEDLLILSPWNGIPMLAPAEFMAE